MISREEIAARQEAYAMDQISRLGIEPSDPDYEEMLSAARRGWPAWRIAQAYKFRTDLIERLLRHR